MGTTLGGVQEMIDWPTSVAISIGSICGTVAFCVFVWRLYR